MQQLERSAWSCLGGDLAPARRSGCAEGPGAPVFCSEQLVLMESLGYFLESHLEIYDQPVRPLELAYESTCDHVNARLDAWGRPNVTAEQLKLPGGDDVDSPQYQSVCLHQIPRKCTHPSTLCLRGAGAVGQGSWWT